MLYKIGKYSFCILSLYLFLSAIKPTWANKDKLLKSPWFESFFSLNQPSLCVRTWLLFTFFPSFIPTSGTLFFSPDWTALAFLLSHLVPTPYRLWISCFFPKRAKRPPKSHFSSQILPKGTSSPILASLHAPLLSILLTLSQVSVNRQSELSEGLGAPPSQLTLQWTKASAALTHSTSS